MVSAPISAIVPDRTPVARRGVFSALGSLGIFVGGLLGVVVASQFVSTLGVGFLVLAVLALVSIPFAFSLRDRARDRADDTVVAPREPFSWSATLARVLCEPSPASGLLLGVRRSAGAHRGLLVDRVVSALHPR